MSIELEIINSVVFDPANNQTALEDLTQEHFTEPDCQKGWEVIQGLRADGKEINIHTFKNRLEQRGANFGDLLAEDSFGSCASKVEELIRLWKVRKIKEYYYSFEQSLNNGEDVDRICGWLADKMTALEMQGVEEDTSFAPVVLKLGQDIADQIKNKTMIRGVSWGIPALDKLVNGIEYQKVYSIGALKKSGKSRFMVSTIQGILQQQLPVLLISLELTKDDIARWIAGKIIGYNFDVPRMTSEHGVKYGLIVAKLTNYPLYIYDKPAGWNKIESIIRRHVLKFKTKFVFIDFFQLISKKFSKNISLSSELDNMAYRFKGLAKELDIAIIYLSQMPVEAERVADAGIGYAKGSGGIEEAADLIMIIKNKNRKENKNPQGRQSLEIKIYGRRCASGVKLNLSADLKTLDFQAEALTEEEF